MPKKRHGKGAQPSARAKPARTPRKANPNASTPAPFEAEEPIGGMDATDILGDDAGDALETRDRNPRDEVLGRDALDDNVQLTNPTEDLAADAVDEIAALASPEEYETSVEGDRRPHRDEAEMGLGGEPRSVDELADRAIGDAIPGPRGTTRDGEVHGEELGLR
jgi:hypothetical protein